MQEFWLTSPGDLFRSFEVVPTKDMNRPARYNALTRLLLFISLILFAMKWNYTATFLFFGLLVLVISYYSQMDEHHENFTPMLERIQNYSGKGVTTPNCQGNPLTHLPLYIPPRGQDYKTANDNNPFVTHSHVNRETAHQSTIWDKDFPSVPDPLKSQRRQKYYNMNKTDMFRGNAVQSHSYMSRDQLLGLFKGKDRICVGSDYQPVSIPLCAPDPQKECRSCGSEFKGDWCDTCGMGSGIDSGEPQAVHHARSMGMDTRNPRRENFSSLSTRETNPPTRNILHPDGGLGTDPLDAGKVLNRGTPSMWYRHEPRQEQFFPEPRELDEFACKDIYVHDRLDPQMVRDPDTVDPGRAAEMPHRGYWSRKMGPLEAPSDSTPIDQINCGTHNADYLLGFQDYKDLAGNIKYQVPEAAYQYPVFSKSKVDHNLFLNPMYGVMPEQQRCPTLQEARTAAETQFLNDTLAVRTNLIDSYLDKFESRRMQQKIAPHSASRGLAAFSCKT